MKKKKENLSEIEAKILPSTIKSIKAKMAKYEDYWDFLHDIYAMRDNVILKFPNHQMGDYEKQVLSQFGFGINDSVIFNDKATIYTTADNGKKINTGFFSPRLFFDWVRYQKY